MEQLKAIKLIFNSEKEFDIFEFQSYLLKQFKESKEKCKTLCFAFLVYDFENAVIRKVLKDNEYWDALNKISGKYIDIFYIDSKENSQTEFQNNYFDNAPKDSFQCMKPIFLQSSFLDKVNIFLKEEFNVSEYVKYPFIIFFQVSNDEIIDNFIIELKKEYLEKAFLELKNLIKDSVETLEKVSEDTFHNHKEIFNLVKVGVKENAPMKIVIGALKKHSVAIVIFILKVLKHS